MEEQAAAQGRAFRELSADEMNELWEQQKKKEKEQ